MWRTSWLSREVIVLPAFIACIAIWWLALRRAPSPATSLLLPLAAIVLAALLWICTAMIYACLRFIEEWAQPLTVVNFVLLGLSSGLVLASTLAALAGEAVALRSVLPVALLTTLVAGAARVWSLRRNAAIRHRSTLQTATGIRSARLVQTSMGMSAGSFNTREFFHRATQAALRRIKLAAIVLSFVVPALVLALVSGGDTGTDRVHARAARAGAGIDRRSLALLRAGEAPAEPVLPGRLVRCARPWFASNGDEMVAIGNSAHEIVPSPHRVRRDLGQTLIQSAAIAADVDGILAAPFFECFGQRTRPLPTIPEVSMTDSPLSLRRRQLLAGSAGALAGTGLIGLAGEAAAQAAAGPAPAASAPRPLPAYAAWKDPNAVTVHSATTIETKRSAFGTSGITPAEQLYIRNNLPAPDASIVANRDAWAVAIEGVRNPRVLTVGDLKTIGVDTVATVLQCSGNGRSYFPHKPSGTPWTVGAAGCVLWSGVPLRYVVEALGGVAPGMNYLTGTGGEKLPDGVDPMSVVVERSVAVKALNDAMLAWEMNGAPLSLAHGGPLRLVVPGYNGVNNVKYVKRVAFTAAESQAKIQQTSYRMTPLGAQSKPSEPSIQELNIKSFVTSPAGDRQVKAGVVYVTGVAFSGGQPIRRVEVSSDGGRTWIDAPFVGPDLGRFAWRHFALPMRMAAGNYVLVSRATDAGGSVQPEQRFENSHGYSHNGWKDPAVQLTVV